MIGILASYTSVCNTLDKIFRGCERRTTLTYSGIGKLILHTDRVYLGREQKKEIGGPWRTICFTTGTRHGGSEYLESLPSLI